MLAKRVIPCLDVHAGRVVKGVNFVNLRDAGDPVEIAARYQDEGADELVFLDITATHEDRDTIAHVVERTAGRVFMPLTVGGGIRNLDDIRTLLNAGADKVSINSAAVKRPELVREAARRFGSSTIVVAMDPKRVRSEASEAKESEDSHSSRLAPCPTLLAPRSSPYYEVFVRGGREATGLEAIAWAKRVAELGAGEILLTSMDRDGTCDGYDLELTRRVAEAVAIPVIASGGAGCPQHLADALSLGKADAALAASIFHFGQYTIHETKRFLADRGISVRL